MVFVFHSTITVQCMVIRTRSVEFMPFFLSLFTFLNGAAWFGYAFVGKVDIFIAVSVTSRSIINSTSHKRVPLHTFIKHFNISILLDSRLFSRTWIPDQDANTHHHKKIIIIIKCSPNIIFAACSWENPASIFVLTIKGITKYFIAVTLLYLSYFSTH